MHRLLLALFLVAAAPAQIQSGANSVTVTVTLGQDLAPDQASFSVTVESASTATLADVLAALQNTGLNASNFSSAYSTQRQDTHGQSFAVMEWSFGVTVAIPAIASEVSSLKALGNGLANGKVPLKLTYSIEGLQVSQQAQAQACTPANLVTAARAKAQQMAAAANLNLGIIQAIYSSVATNVGPTPSQTSVVPRCSLMVKFSMGGY